jgi:hypothetical protein
MTKRTVYVVEYEVSYKEYPRFFNTEPKVIWESGVKEFFNMDHANNFVVACIQNSEEYRNFKLSTHTIDVPQFEEECRAKELVLAASLQRGLEDAKDGRISPVDNSVFEEQLDVAKQVMAENQSTLAALAAQNQGWILEPESSPREETGQVYKRVRSVAAMILYKLRSR